MEELTAVLAQEICTGVKGPT